MSDIQTRYSLVPGTDAVPFGQDAVLFRSDHLSIKVEGRNTRAFLDRVLPLLQRPHRLEDLSRQLPHLPRADLLKHLQALVQAGVLRESAGAAETVADDPLEPFLALLNAVGLPRERAIQRLGSLRVALFGLDGPGAQTAALLARCGIGTLVLADPFACRPADLLHMPGVGMEAAGRPRQQVVQDLLLGQGYPGNLVACGETLDGDTLLALAAGCDLLISTFDRGFSSCHHWVNQAALKLGVPALFGEIRGHLAFAGPLVLPGRTGCFMCYRMRSTACEPDFEAAMCYEEYLDQRRAPALHNRGGLPATSACLAGVLGAESINLLLALNQPNLAGSVLELDALRLSNDKHPVLQVPDCPACGKKKISRNQPGLKGIVSANLPQGDLDADGWRFLSGRTGIVKGFQAFQKDPSEPASPYVFQARLSNHRFLTGQPADGAGCSGKGFSPRSARVSTLGEAVERYSGACWSRDEIRFVPRDRLPGPSLDPSLLVLYAPDQYPALRYAPYSGANPLGWVQARSLVSGDELWVPALAVFMNYEVGHPQEFICPVSSNGLGAGPSLAAAIRAGALEVIERDAFVISWLARLRALARDPLRHPDRETVSLCESYRRRGVAMRLFALPSDVPCHVFAAVGVQEGEGDGPAAAVGLGADMDPALAARRAILEVGQIRPALGQRLRRPEDRQRLRDLLEDPQRVENLEDHDLLYADKGMLGAFDFWFDSPQGPSDWETRDTRDPLADLESLVDHFRQRDGDILYVNLTPPDMAGLGLYTARVIIPGFQPIHFGWHERRLGGERLFELPRQLGQAAGRISREQLNPFPHPLA